MKKAGFLSLLALVCVSIALVSQATSGTQVVNKIHGGNEADPGEFSFMAAIYEGPPGKREFRCSASLIDDRYLLSAAHCMPKNKLGCHNLKGPFVEYAIESFLGHDGFKKFRTPQFDIAIMRTKEPVKFTGPIGKGSIGPIELPESMDGDYEVGERLITIGWGWLNTVDHATVLMKADVSPSSLEQCKTLDSDASDASICTTSPTEGTCRGDSGGPLFRVDDSGRASTLIGIISGSIGHCRSNGGSFYTRVAYFSDWIEAGKMKLEAAR